MKQSKAIGIVLYSIIYLVIGISFIVNTPQNLQYNYYTNYLTLVLCYFIVAGILLIAYISTPMDIFEPIVFVTFLYIMIFSIAPIINMITGETLFFGKDIMGGAQKATWIFLISYVAFVIGYFLNKKKRPIRKEIKPFLQVPSEIRKKILVIVVGLWMFSYLVSIIVLLSDGKNFIYILTVGTFGNIDSNRQVDTPLGFISMIGYLLIPTWMYINAYSKNGLLKKTLFILTLIIFVVRGFRFVIVILIMAPIIYYYIKNNKRPGPILLISLTMIMVFMIGIIGYMRGDVRTGNDIDWQSLNLNFILEAVKGNFDIYQPFYGMVQIMPEQLEYSYGSQIFVYTIIMFIPRAIWPTKPYSNIDEVLALSISKYASEAGIAFPNIGEFYMEFGVSGCILLMFIFGKLCSWCKKLYQEKKSDHAIIAYSIILPALMQIVIRGYTPSNFYLILLLLLPILVIKNITKKHG